MIWHLCVRAHVGESLYVYGCVIVIQSDMIDKRLLPFNIPAVLRVGLIPFACIYRRYSVVSEYRKHSFLLLLSLMLLIAIILIRIKIISVIHDVQIMTFYHNNSLGSYSSSSNGSKVSTAHSLIIDKFVTRIRIYLLIWILGQQVNKSSTL